MARISRYVRQQKQFPAQNQNEISPDICILTIFRSFSRRPYSMRCHFSNSVLDSKSWKQRSIKFKHLQDLRSLNSYPSKLRFFCHCSTMVACHELTKRHKGGRVGAPFRFQQLVKYWSHQINWLHEDYNQVDEEACGLLQERSLPFDLTW